MHICPNAALRRVQPLLSLRPQCAAFPFESASILVACGVVIEGPQGIPFVFLLGSYPEFYATRVAPAKCIAGALVFAGSRF